MSSSSEHWNNIFCTKADPQLGWYEGDVTQTLKFLAQIPPGESRRVFLPGAGTSSLVEELLNRGHELILNDISDEALNKLRHRVGTNDKLTYLHHDISKTLPDGISPIDLWIDRAVLHFLLDEDDIQTYFSNLKSAIRLGGYALLAEFSLAGAPKCAGLELHRYCVDELSRRMCPEFVLVEHEDYTYINPAGDPRPYVYALFKT
ncbi:putative S-adenosyl-L-methionine-dependent methyltransferase [Novipirellula artificiosorum]|uniref:Putative S-adenosyl-L-methionine-dependent methyltransferase n=2 Tax=Novipirellula artificiosorum TaxID=2528016 RepID=A0A5C6DX77_9BACT|nr:putative S-adenosyl-L-methionine-dependent methyltransferase [Novipirellula artificiosorum]